MNGIDKYEHYVEFLEKIPIASVLTTFDADTPIILAANKLHEKLTGFSMDELAGKTPKRVFFPMTQSGADIRASLKEFHTWNGVIYNTNKERELQKLELTIIPVVLDGAKYYVGIKRKLKKKRWWKKWFQ